MERPGECSRHGFGRLTYFAKIRRLDELSIGSRMAVESVFLFSADEFCSLAAGSFPPD
jgi:hypothetical protein